MRNTPPAGLCPLDCILEYECIDRLVSGYSPAYSYLPASVPDFHSPEGLAAWMRDAGFSKVSYPLLTGGIVAIHVGRK